MQRPSKRSPEDNGRRLVPGRRLVQSTPGPEPARLPGRRDPAALALREPPPRPAPALWEVLPSRGALPGPGVRVPAGRALQPPSLAAASD